MFRALLHPGATRVGTDHVDLAVQQFAALGNVCNVGNRPCHAVHQAGFAVGADVRLHAEVILAALLGLVHLGIAFAVLVLDRTRRMDQRGRRRWCPGAATGHGRPAGYE
jgi:hypothetical protein